MNGGNGFITISNASLDQEQEGDLLVVEFSLVKWIKCLGCHKGVKKGIHIDANLSNIVIVYSTVVVVMMEMVHRQM